MQADLLVGGRSGCEDLVHENQDAPLAQRVLRRSGRLMAGRCATHSACAWRRRRDPGQAAAQARHPAANQPACWQLGRVGQGAQAPDEAKTNGRRRQFVSAWHHSDRGLEGG